MFTGLIEDVGKIKNIIKNHNGYKLYISSKVVTSDLKIGDSVAVNGICLTAVEINNDVFSVDVMNETILKTSLSKSNVNSSVNLERALLVGSRYGGHIVSGHIDGTGTISSIQPDGIAFIYTIKTNKEILKYIIKKGSITIDGISLTVTYVDDLCFKVSIIPHTLQMTNMKNKKINDLVNLENDCIAKYVEKLLNNQEKEKEYINLLKGF